MRHRRSFAQFGARFSPKRLPKPPEDTTAKLNPESVYTFLLFFKKYLHDHIAGIRKRRGNMGFAVGGMAAYAQEPDNALLICGRRSLLTAYQDWLQERDVELDISAEAALQAALTEGGIPFRTGGRDTTWKYKLSPADKPLPCMGVALNDLLSLFEQHEISIGMTLGACFHSNRTTAKPKLILLQKLMNRRRMRHEGR